MFYNLRARSGNTEAIQVCSSLSPFEEAHINLMSSLQLTEFYILSSSAFELCHSVISSPEPKAHRWAYSIPMVRRPSSSVRRRRPSSSTMLKHLLLRNRLADQSQILCGASLGRGNEILFAASGSHDQDGRHAHIWKKPFKNLLQNRRADFHETWYVASGTPAHHKLFKWWPWCDLDLFYGKVKFGNIGFSIGKSENSGFFRNYCSQWPESW